MNSLIANIALQNGVKGCAIFHKEQGVLGWDGDGSIDENVLRELSVYLVKLQLLGVKNGLGIRASNFYFSDLKVIGVPYSPEAIMVICCLEGCNTEELTKLVAAHRQSSGQPKQSADVTQELDYSRYKELVELPHDLGSPGEIISDDEELDIMRDYYEQLYDSLAELIGPLADYVVQDSLARWRKNGPAIPARIYELVSMMGAEIENPRLAEEFLNRFENMS
ncbi:MAG: hypothetical protein OEM02_10040 [Desulfobulbaceae bacterium]|nr:hypothetical protein [Desulfobulbaceae bacterium]